jgi:hypothetical protein
MGFSVLVQNFGVSLRNLERRHSGVYPVSSNNQLGLPLGLQNLQSFMAICDVALTILSIAVRGVLYVIRYSDLYVCLRDSILMENVLLSEKTRQQDHYAAQILLMVLLAGMLIT